MKQGMTNVDVAALAAELAPLLVGARLDKAYQPGKEAVLLRVRRKGTGKVDVYFELGRFITATKRPPANPDKPSMVAQILRTTLENARVRAFHQVGFDRLIRMDLERGDGIHSLVFELFGDGNLLLLDKNGVIELPMRGVDHGARRLRKGEPYLPPPGASLPFAMDVAALQTASEGSKDLVRFLAVNLGFGPLWGEELCLRCGIDKKTLIADLTSSQWQAVHQTIQSLGTDITRNDLAPAVVHEDGKPVDAVPFVMMRYPAPKFSHEESPTFRDALDILYRGAGGEEGDEEPDDPRRARFDEARGKVEQQLKMMDAASAGFIAEEAEAKRDGEAIFASFHDVQRLLDELNQARKGRSWMQVEEVLAKGRAEGNPVALQVPELRPHEGSALFLLADTTGRQRKVEVDLRLSVQDNAEARFAVAKKARSRREGAATARRDAEGRLAAIDAKGLDAFGVAPVRVERQSRHFWFESYRWTLTPSGFIAVGGRNAPQNDQVVKKYLRDGDRYVHADAHGAPSVVLRPAEGSADAFAPEDLRAAAQFAAVSSRAWRQGASASAYWVTAQQVSKTPRSGEFVPRGAWIIHGRRNAEEDLPMECWVGLITLRPDGIPVPANEAAPVKAHVKLVAGGKAALTKFAKESLRIMPGTMDPNDAAALLAERFGVAIEEAQGVLPAGPVQIDGLSAKKPDADGDDANRSTEPGT